ncbi:MAG TPA: selenocysteine-specific translation elongation factor [Gemmatimonadaceae bacterium]|nr:selenocysteine-specific translation elongation factor [Gemmatimonadaceae bacterium]
MILGTAGHIDHGKTTLVRALTGVDTDRLPEEKRRGITIDLGFAPLALDGVGTVGVVDVPGHEAFVRTMVAGATGIDLALLVVAADEGVMPQTREHLAILSLLGVRAGVVALTKRDLVDADWLALVEDDVRETIEASALAGAAIVPVSANTGAGLAELRAALSDVVRGIPARAADDVFRLPIDRAFTVKGTGTVITGTVWSGALARDATVRLLPADVPVRVRGLHAHGHPVDRVQAGDRAALALAGVDLDQVGRGAVLVQGAAWRATRIVRADVALFASAPRALGPRSRVRLHLGTSDVSARLVVPGGILGPGARASARVVLDEAIVARAGDRFVLRSASPVATMGGGVVLDPLAPIRARAWPADDRAPAALLARVVAEGGTAGVPIGELPVRLGVAPAAARQLVDAHGGWRVGERLIGEAARASLADEALATLAGFHADQPLEPGAPLQWLRSRLRAPDEVSAALLLAMSTEGPMILEQGLARERGFVPRLSVAQDTLRANLLNALESAGQEPPSLEELAVTLGVSASTLTPVVRLLAREGSLVAVEPSRYYPASTVTLLLARLREGMRADADYGPAELRELLGFSRKFLIPFLEFADRAGHTLRDPGGRRRRAGT